MKHYEILNRSDFSLFPCLLTAVANANAEGEAGNLGKSLYAVTQILIGRMDGSSYVFIDKWSALHNGRKVTAMLSRGDSSEVVAE